MHVAHGKDEGERGGGVSLLCISSRWKRTVKQKFKEYIINTQKIMACYYIHKTLIYTEMANMTELNPVM